MNNLLSKIYLKENAGNGFKHRSGWNYVVSYLKKLNIKNGVLFDTFIEKSFGYKPILKYSYSYKEPWIGIFHVPDNIPNQFGSRQTPKEIFKNKYFTKSLKYCLGFYCLSNYEKEILRKYTSLPISVILHPTETPEVKFSFEKFIKNDNKEIIQLGTFLRKLTSIFLLKVNNLKKSALGIDEYNHCLLEIESLKLNLKINIDDVKIYKHLSKDEYDNVLSKNIAFMDLYDASANNAVIECIVRNTPLLIKRCPAVIEYLGIEYPFYFENLDEASRKAENIELIKKTYEYLKILKTKKMLTGEYFLKDIANSEIYKNLKIPKFNSLKYLKRLHFRFILNCITFLIFIMNKIKRILIFTFPRLFTKIRMARINKKIN